MRARLKIFFLSSFLLVYMVGVANATTIQLSFEVAAFIPLTPIGPTSPPPQAIVNGTIIYEAGSLGAAIDSLTSINLTISGYTYTTSEIGSYEQSVSGGSTAQFGHWAPVFYKNDTFFNGIGGLITGASGIRDATNDFFIRYGGYPLDASAPYI